MKRLALLLAFVPFLLGCATGGARGREECPTLTVENQNYYDATIYNSEGVRVTRVQGLTTRTISTCKLLSRQPVFNIVGQANSFSLTLRGHGSYLDRQDEVKLIIGGNPRISFIIGGASG